MKKAVMFWSTGKDSAYCLHEVVSKNKYNVVYLITTLNEKFNRVSMHGIHADLLEKQTDAIGIPLLKMMVTEGSYDAYEEEMERILLRVKEEGIDHVIFGDILLEDLKAYREEQLEKLNMHAVFPLWKSDTKDMANKIISSGFKSRICCVNDAYFQERDLGKEYDLPFLNSLSEDIDPCGENGEFHSFCYDGPIFKYPLNVEMTEKVYQELPENAKDTCNLPAEKITKGFWFGELKSIS